MKLLWQEAHFRFTPMNTCEMFCAVCICGVWLALIAPRHTMPLLKPSESGVGIDQLRDEAVVGHVLGQRGIEPAGDLLAPAVDVAGAAIIVPQRIVPEASSNAARSCSCRASRVFTSRSRLSLCLSATNVFISFAEGSRPITSR